MRHVASHDQSVDIGFGDEELAPRVQFQTYRFGTSKCFPAFTVPLDVTTPIRIPQDPANIPAMEHHRSVLHHVRSDRIPLEREVGEGDQGFGFDDHFFGQVGPHGH